MFFGVGVLGILVLASCSKDDGSSMTALDDPDFTGGMILAQGSFSGNRNYQVSGSAKVLEQGGKKVLRLEDFASSNGPDLKVYLSRDINASQFIDLGRLRSVSGNQNYDISGMPDLDQFPFALIWCEQFGALFGSANLK
jgi:hypothetical protein